MAFKSKPPAHPREISDKIVHYGGFLEGLEFILKLMRSQTSTSIILRGNVGTGKKSLIKVATSLCQDSVITIYLNPYHHTDDYSALKNVAVKLGLKLRSSLQEIMEDIEVRSGLADKKIVLVLLDFEEFCRQKQSLLYCLTTLTQHGHNISLVGLTISLDCTEHLEKRVRSRVNTLFYELEPPYRNKKEYVEFASILLGDYKIKGGLKEHLEYMYVVGNKSIRPFKRYLISICSWDDNGVLTVNQPISSNVNPQSKVNSLAERFSWLTKPQQELLKVAVCYCQNSETTDFALQDLNDYARRHSYFTFDTISPLATRNTATLAKIGLFKPLKPSQMISQLSTFTIGVTPIELKRVLDENPNFHSLKTDPLWKRLH